jgi:hypothetical protein
MPCKFCKDHSHALNNCNSPRLQEFGEYMTAVLANHTYDFVSQMRELYRFTASQLAGLCKYLNVRNTGSKAVLTTAIIAQRFVMNVNSHDIDSAEEQKIMDLLFCAEYSYLINPLSRVGTVDLNMGLYAYVCDKLLKMLDLHINARYCVVREAADNSWTMRGKVMVASSAPLNVEMLHQNMLERVRLNQASFMLRAQMSNKLTIQIEEREEEDDVEECGICYDVKTVAGLNCGHAFCRDCLYNTALSRKGAHICCAFCRAQIETISLKGSKAEFESVMNAT